MTSEIPMPETIPTIPPHEKWWSYVFNESQKRGSCPFLEGQSCRLLQWRICMYMTDFLREWSWLNAHWTLTERPCDRIQQYYKK